MARYTMNTLYRDGDTWEGEPHDTIDGALDSITWEVVHYVEIEDNEMGTVRVHSYDPR